MRLSGERFDEAGVVELVVALHPAVGQFVNREPASTRAAHAALGSTVFALDESLLATPLLA